MGNSYIINQVDVLVIGCGGAGLRAAIAAKLEGANVLILGKRSKLDAHTVLAAGGINAAFGNVDKEDSWRSHYADTYLEGYGLADPDQIKILTQEAPSLVNEIDEWGANLAKLKNGDFDQRFFGAHKYRRTCYSGDFTGASIINALIRKSDDLKIPILDSHYVTDLLIEQKRCFGAFSFNLKNGERIAHTATSTIICTGGHTRIWSKSTSRSNENTGDGLHLALKAGCELVDMEMVQFHPTGMVAPKEMIGTLVTEAVRGEGGRLINANGERFMKNYDYKRMELSTRDRVAYANYTEINEGRGTCNGGVFLDLTHIEKSKILEKLPSTFKQFQEAQGIDISKNPIEVAPTAHYSMGGIVVNAKSHVTNIQGLYAAGEVAGGLHGANRLGGNSLAEILVFGKIVGKSAAEFSRTNQLHISINPINHANENINHFLNKKGKEDIKDLQNQLRTIMWEYCGVSKNEKMLQKGLENIYILKSKSKNIMIENNKNHFENLRLAMDLESSLLSANATLIASLSRKESRGSHNRDDFKEINKNELCNYIIKKSRTSSELSIHRKEIKNIDYEFQKQINSNFDDFELKDRLLE
tara:strand:+ start:2472 stop:4226 length:1755 start_codon:yes stop_codon:yes gene_type:complete